MKPVKVEKISTKELLIVWDTGHESRYAFKDLRDSCPCASCSGESVLLHRYEPPPFDRSAKGRYELVGAAPVGSYALQLRWADGHDAGIYTWEKLWNACPCGEHKKNGAMMAPDRK